MKKIKIKRGIISSINDYRPGFGNYQLNLDRDTGDVWIDVHAGDGQTIYHNEDIWTLCYYSWNGGKAASIADIKRMAQICLECSTMEEYQDRVSEYQRKAYEEMQRREWLKKQR